MGPSGLADRKSHTAYEGRVCLANSMELVFFQGEIVNPLQEQTVPSTLVHLHNRQHAVYAGGPSFSQSRPGHTSRREDRVGCDSDSFYRTVGCRAIRPFCWGCLMPELR